MGQAKPIARACAAKRSPRIAYPSALGWRPSASRAASAPPTVAAVGEREVRVGARGQHGVDEPADRAHAQGAERHVGGVAERVRATGRIEPQRPGAFLAVGEHDGQQQDRRRGMSLAHRVEEAVQHQREGAAIMVAPLPGC